MRPEGVFETFFFFPAQASVGIRD